MRVITRKAKRSASTRPARFSVSTSYDPNTRFSSQTHNVLAASFIPGSFQGIIFLTSPAMVAHDEGKNFGSEFSVLANSLIRDFGGKARFLYTLPAKELAPGITAPQGIRGDSLAIPIASWADLTPLFGALPR